MTKIISDHALRHQPSKNEGVTLPYQVNDKRLAVKGKVCFSLDF